jgi:hypothetical protein
MNKLISFIDIFSQQLQFQQHHTCIRLFAVVSRHYHANEE